MPEGKTAISVPKPVSAVPLRVGNIPKALKALNRWILWRYTFIPKTGKWTKTPHSAKTGHKVDATNFENGTSFIDALNSLRGHKKEFDGLGFLLGAGIAGIDVDDCIDENGNLGERGQSISEQYQNTYAEISPSGRGFKLLVDIGDDPKLAVIGKNNGEMEIYGGNRYFTVTGHVLPGHALHIAPMQEAFARTAESMGVKRELAPMPMGQHKERSGFDYKAARELLDHLPFQWVDLYHDWLRAGMALHHEFDGDPQALELWDEWSQRNPAKYDAGACELRWSGFGKPGKDEVTMRTLVRDAQSTGWRAPATVARAIADFTPFDEDESDSELSWWQRYSAGALLKSDPQPKEWVWEGVLRRGKVMVLAGSGGSSKSYLMLGSAVQYALGNSWGPFKIPDGAPPGRVLLMYGEEDKEDVHDRLHSLKHAFMLTDDQITTVEARVAVLPLRGTSIELAREEGQHHEIVITDQMARLEARITEFKIKLVVMDPMALLHSLEENDNHAIAKFIGGIDALCMRTGAAVILVHHFGKNGNMHAREVNEANVRGASALVAHARTVVVMHRMREDEAREWGIDEADHARWVMWAVAKNNYGRSGGRFWFNVDDHTGAITPAPAQPTFLNARDIREIDAQSRQQDEERSLTTQEERNARAAAEEMIAMNGRIFALLTDAISNSNKLTTINRAQTVIMAGGMECTPKRARTTIERIKELDLVDTDGTLNRTGRKWMDEHELLG